MAPFPGREDRPGRSGMENRLFVDAVLWLARTASSRRDLPPEFGKWTALHARFRRWTISGIWESLFNRLSAGSGFEYVLIDGTICKVQGDATSANSRLGFRRSGDRAAGLTTKILSVSMPLACRYGSFPPLGTGACCADHGLAGC
ncbi:transposase [Rhodovulum sulfidophilum]|uniref:transposase n=1 Tax=Rhodovulum sulfidophilum TaxID=35806 RepID=UPI002E304DE0|nr:transposase [Rhodovulum sulfidophilum]